MTSDEMKRFIVNRATLDVGTNITSMILGIMGHSQPTQFDEGLFHKLVEDLINEGLITTLGVGYNGKESTILFPKGVIYRVRGMNIAT